MEAILDSILTHLYAFMNSNSEKRFWCVQKKAISVRLKYKISRFVLWRSLKTRSSFDINTQNNRYKICGVKCQPTPPAFITS